jgi:hypothetical protein
MVCVRCCLFHGFYRKSQNLSTNGRFSAKWGAPLLQRGEFFDARGAALGKSSVVAAARDVALLKRGETFVRRGDADAASGDAFAARGAAFGERGTPLGAETPPLVVRAAAADQSYAAPSHGGQNPIPNPSFEDGKVLKKNGNRVKNFSPQKNQAQRINFAPE